MNQRQAMRIALAVNASYLLFGATTVCVTDSLSDADAERFSQAQKKMAQNMLRRAGFDEPMLEDEIIAKVLGK
jgi:hypothetical protein